MKMYSVHDSKAEAYLAPFTCNTHGLALRMFETSANEEGHMFQRFAADYTLFCIGEFDESTGQLHPYTVHENLGKALDYVRQNQSDPTQLNIIGGDA